MLNPLSPVETMELLLDKLGKTRSNAEFLGCDERLVILRVCQFRRRADAA